MQFNFLFAHYSCLGPNCLAGRAIIEIRKITEVIAPYHYKNVLSLEHSLYCVIVLKYSKGSLFIVIRNKQLEIEI